MLLQDKFVKRKKFKREGVLKTFILPTDSVKVLGDKKYSVKIDEKTKSLKCVGGKYPYVITDSIGICEKSTFSLFFVEDAMVINLKKGYLYLKQSDGKILLVDSKNKVITYEGDNAEISWRPLSDMVTICNNMVKGKFRVESPVIIDRYRNNLIFEMTCYYHHNEGNLFSLKFGDLDYTLGNEEFDFEVFEKKETVVESKPFIEKEFKKKGKDNVNNFDFNDEDEEELQEIDDMLYDSEDDNFDDIDELPSHMHEIDIFAEYSEDDM